MAACGWIVVGLLLASLVVSGVAHSTARGQAEAFRVQVGAFTVLAERHTISAAGFPEGTMNPFRRTAVHRFQLRHDGRPLSVAPPGRPDQAVASFNMVYHLADAPRPALLVPARLGVHLLDQGDHGVHMQALPVMEQPVVSLQWLDATAGQPGPTVSPRLQAHAPASLRLQGGRWLLVNRSVVVDVDTLQAHPVRPWIPQGSDQPMAGLNASTEPALAFSPHGSQYVTLAGGADGAPEGGDRALLVVDIPTGNPYGVAIPPRLRADVDAGRVDAAWISRHFVWCEHIGVERLVAAADPDASP